MKEKAIMALFLIVACTLTVMAIGDYKTGQIMLSVGVDTLSDTANGDAATDGSFTSKLIYNGLEDYSYMTGKVIVNKPFIAGVGDVSGADTVGIYLYTELGDGRDADYAVRWRRKLDSSLANTTLPCTLSFAIPKATYSAPIDSAGGTLSDTLLYNRLTLDITTACSATAAALVGKNIEYKTDYWILLRQ